MEAGMKFKDLVYEHQDYEALQKQVDKLTEEVAEAKSYEDVKRIIFESEKNKGTIVKIIVGIKKIEPFS